MDIHQILEILPHRYPLLLVDRVLEIESGKRIVGIKNVTANEPWFSGHFPGRPVMPGVLIVEALAQCAGLLLMEGLDDPQSKIVYLLGMDRVKFRAPGGARRPAPTRTRSSAGPREAGSRKERGEGLRKDRCRGHHPGAGR